MEFLYAFGVGIAFAIGIFTGAWMCRLSVRHALLDHDKKLEVHTIAVEDRLAKYVENTGRIADALEKTLE